MWIAMKLNVNPNYPNCRSYVLQLHFDAAPQRERLRGRLENMASGHHFTFYSGTELLAWLINDLAINAFPKQEN
jgi:hypothetical protein